LAFKHEKSSTDRLVDCDLPPIPESDTSGVGLRHGIRHSITEDNTQYVHEVGHAERDAVAVHVGGGGLLCLVHLEYLGSVQKVVHQQKCICYFVWYAVQVDVTEILVYIGTGNVARLSGTSGQNTEDYSE